MNITVIEKNGKKFVTCVDEGFEHPVETLGGLCDGRYTGYPPRSVCVNTMTPYNNWVNELAEAAQNLVSAFHYEGRAEYQFKADMSMDMLQSLLWRLIKKLNEVLKEGDE